jgi:glycosyltransferase involved in cell wall biosynthesis
VVNSEEQFGDSTPTVESQRERAAIRAGGVQPQISVVIPVYNSAGSLEKLVERLLAALGGLGRSFEIVFVEDCGPDQSWEVLKQLKARHPKHLRITRLLRNSGQHNAILCGFSLCRGEFVITMDDDLQNPPEEIPKLIAAIESGYDLAIGAYDSKKHSAVRNKSGDLIDSVNRQIFGLPPDFCLTSFRAIRSAVVKNACQMGGVFPYVTSMLLSHTSKYVNVPVRHDPRLVGKSNYDFKRSLLLASNLIFSYSTLPITAVGWLCALAFLFSISFGTMVLIGALVHGSGVPGWASTMVTVSFFNALILLCMFIFGLYISRLNQQISRTRVSFTISELHE